MARGCGVGRTDASPRARDPDALCARRELARDGRESPEPAWGGTGRSDRCSAELELRHELRPCPQPSRAFGAARGAGGRSRSPPALVYVLLLVASPAAVADLCNEQTACVPRSQTAYVTLVSTSEYVLPALVLGHSLKRTGTLRSLVCMVTRDLSEDSIRRLDLVFDRVVQVEEVAYSGHTSPDGPFSGGQGAFLAKLRVLEMEEYRRVVYIGSDAIAVAPVDELFACIPPCGVADIALWEMTELGVTVNGDVLVLAPSRDDAAAMERLAAKYHYRMERAHLMVPVYCGPWQPRNETYVGPLDQALLNQHYRNRFTILPHHYNFMPYIFSPALGMASSRGWLWDRRRVKIMHYARLKPWKAEDFAGIEYAAGPWRQMRGEVEELELERAHAART